MMKNRKLFLSDMDGSLLDDHKHVPRKARKAIAQFVEAGGIFTIATGRTELSCSPATSVIPVTAPVVLYNGACVMDLKSHNILYEKTLDAKKFRPVLKRLMNHFPTLCVEIFAYGPILQVNPNAPVDPYVLREKQSYVRTALDDTPEKWLKIIFYGEQAELQEVAEYLEQKILDLPDCNTVFSTDFCLEILHPDCSKGAAARWLAAYLGIPAEDVGVLGDNLNDEELLSWCGCPYAPANAHDHIKDIAIVTSVDNNQGAIAEALSLFTE